MRVSYLRRIQLLFQKAEMSGDWGYLVAPGGDKLQRTALLKACNFPRSTLYQNAKVKALLAKTELHLLATGVLKSPKYSQLPGECEEQFQEQLEVRLSALNVEVGNVLGRLRGLMAQIDQGQK